MALRGHHVAEFANCIELFEVEIGQEPIRRDLSEE